jgi:glycosyltransferase involved in cell wall biosynthesis
VAVLAWSLAHNPAGRALTLAGVLERAFEVEVVGACFPAYGKGLWEPVRDTTLTVRSFPGELFPRHWTRLEGLAGELRADVIYASKPRFPSFALGALGNARSGAPLMLDIDDDEPALTGLDGPIGLDELAGETAAPSFPDPTGSLWTGVCAGLAGAADRVTVANHELDEGLGGLVVPHARDERLFDPARFDRLRERARLGLSADDRVVMFVGTPGRHKGLLETAAALKEIGDPRYKLCVIGRDMDRTLRPLLERTAGRHLRWHGTQPVSLLPANLAAADLVCVLQDPSNRVARRQTPAKVTDAMAMGVPVLGSPTPPLAELGARGLIELLGDEPLAERLRAMLEAGEEARHRALHSREVFLSELSYAAVLPSLEQAVHDVLREGTGHAPELDELLGFCQSAFS